MLISWIILYYCDILIFYINVILYLCTGGYKQGLHNNNISDIGLYQRYIS